MSSLIVEYIFPTVVAFENNVFSDKENNDILNNCYDIAEKFSNSHDYWLSGQKSPKNTYGSFNISQHPPLSFFIEKITKKVNEFAKINNDEKQYLCSDGWVNIYDKDNYQEPHHHFNRTYSAVYFPLAPLNSGKICFLNPSVYQLGSENKDFPTSTSWIYTPVPKMLLIFRSNLMHYVLHGENSSDRVSIAMNFMQSPEDYAKEFNSYTSF
jgi:uncharacterized protein (TIGR02466 family)